MYQERLQRLSSEDFTVVGLVGSGRSGSTLAEQILGTGSGYFNVGEVVEVFRSLTENSRPCECGQPFLQCDFWTEVGERSFGGWSRSLARRVQGLEAAGGRNRAVLSPFAAGAGAAGDKVAQRYRSVYQDLFSAVATVSGAQVLVDASKWPGHSWLLGGGDEIDLRVVQLVRDPRGVAYSWNKPPTKLEQHAVWRSAPRWVEMQLAGRKVRRRQPHHTVLRYEDLAAAPESALERAMSEVGLKWRTSAFSSRDTVAVTSGHALAGNPRRARGSRELTVRIDDAWRQEMPVLDRLLVTMTTAPLLRAYGYPIAPSTPPPGQSREA